MIVFKRIIYLDEYINVEKYIDIEKSSYGSLAEIWPLEHENEESIREVFDHFASLKENAKITGVYLKKDIPEKFQIKNHKRTAPILITAYEGVQIVIEPKQAKKFAIYHGNHGYDPDSVPNMRGIFIAHGTSFKKSYYSKKPVKLIDVYSLMCSLLRIKPKKNDGVFDRISHFLKNIEFNVNDIHQDSTKTEL